MTNKCKFCGEEKNLTQNHTSSGKMVTGIICIECFRKLSEKDKKVFWVVLDRIEDSSQFLDEFNEELTTGVDNPCKDGHVGIVYNPLDGKWRWL